MKRIIPFIVVAVAVSIVGCASKPIKIEETRYYKPLNTLQQEFYDIQSMYEQHKYAETIDLGKTFLEKYKRDILSVAVHYYVAASYQKTGELAQAEEHYNAILETNKEDEWGKLATVGLREIKEARNR